LPVQRGGEALQLERDVWSVLIGSFRIFLGLGEFPFMDDFPIPVLVEPDEVGIAPDELVRIHAIDGRRPTNTDLFMKTVMKSF
jgi:hypothetical protein